MHESSHGHAVAYEIAGVDNITVRFDSEFVHTFGSWYIPHMDKNLISIKELESTGFVDALDDGMIKIFKVAHRTLKLLGEMAYRSHTEVLDVLNSTIISIRNDHTRKWHNMLAYVSVKGLKFLNLKGIFGKDQVLTCHFLIIVCLVNIKGCYFHLVHIKASKVLKYIHTDL